VKIVESLIKKEAKKDGIPTFEVKKEGEADKILVVMIGPLTYGEASALDVLRK
jgi:ribosome-interacting GTPase 1